MSFYHDSTGVSTDRAFKLLPDKQWFPFKIVSTEESKSKSGYDMVKCVCEVIDDPNHAGSTVWHWVVFIPKGNDGDGMSVHFRKCIGQPYGGNDLVDPDSWRGARFMGKVAISEYNGKQNNKIVEISPYELGGKPDDAIPF